MPIASTVRRDMRILPIDHIIEAMMVLGALMEPAQRVGPA